LKTRLRKGKKQYLVKWLGFPSEQNSWVAESDMVTPEAELTQPAINYLSTRAKTQSSKSIQSLPKFSQNCQANQVSYIFSWIYLLMGMLVLITCISIGSTASIDIGPLYDCSRVYHTALYKFSDHSQFEHKMHLGKSKVQYFNADVLQYSPL
jgi:hypothetical protein